MNAYKHAVNKVSHDSVAEWPCQAVITCQFFAEPKKRTFQECKNTVKLTSSI